MCLCLATRHFNTVNESLKVTSLYSDLYKTDTSLIHTLCSFPFGVCIKEVQLYSFSFCFFFFYLFYFILFILFFLGGGGVGPANLLPYTEYSVFVNFERTRNLSE